MSIAASIALKLAAFGKRWWPHMLVAALVIAAGVTIVMQAKRIDALQGQLVTAKRDLAAARETAKLSEALRGQEQAQAVTSYAAQDVRCQDRIITARDAGQAIGEIVNAPATPAAAVRPIVPADMLRRIIGQPSAGSAAGVSVGSNNGGAK